MNEMKCSAYYASYCPAHDYDHVLERREAMEEQNGFNRTWSEFKNEFARREREQEERAFLSDPDFLR